MLRIRAACRFFLLLLLIAGLSACALMHPDVAMRSAVIEVAPGANDDTPIAVDFLAVDDPDLLKTLLTISSSQWFAAREQYRRDYPQALQVWGLEVVPGQRLVFERVPIAGVPALSVLVFASYDAPGAHRLRLEGERDVRLRLDSRSLQLAGQ
ncbi:type VI secretion protein [Jeongeupia chitinilytica]|uniref:Type VI secretion protein n=1 Tax=Jeongeupia chitinilytica TaxID=1041641 RepID=A0ABQ3GUZ0_9NEIS|nr:type VI secretion protein [Jeongeupia chitinilytica]GHD56214.1 hypothetical protein GCM10007350_02850 [Jeongeupia chitinilytica]